MSSLDTQNQPHGYWRSLAELTNAPEFQESQRLEFPGGVPEEGEFSAVNRRRFAQILGASAALAGAVGCRWPQEKVLPFSKRPEGVVPGAPRYYATAFEIGGVAQPLLVTSYDGRPTKVDGNPEHPASQTFRADGSYKYAKSIGASTVYAQASILEMYDPDRSKSPAKGAGGVLTDSTWEALGKDVLGLLDREKRESSGAGVCVLAEATSSPTFLALRKKFKDAYPRASWYEYEPLSDDAEREGLKAVFGKPYRTLHLLERAVRLVTLDADPFGAHPNSVQYSRDFSRGRKPEQGQVNRFYAIESNYTLSGATADHRLPLRSSEQYAFLAAVARELQAALKDSPDAEGAFAFVEGLPAAADLLKNEESLKFARALAGDLAQNVGRSTIMVGPNQPKETHALAAALNLALGGVEKTVRYLPVEDADRPTHLAAVEKLAARIGAADQNVKLLLVLGGNPVYNAPANLKFAEKLTEFVGRGTAVHFSQYRDETSRLCTWHAARSHFLESWGDVRTLDGTTTLQQPLIEPLYSTKSAIEFLSFLLEETTPALELVQKNVAAIGEKQSAGSGFWERAVHDGFVRDTGLTGEKPTLAAGAKAKTPEAARPNAWEVVFVPDNSVLDGRYTNNAWLQEAPDFLTKLTWDNALLVGPETARRTGLKHEQVVKLDVLGAALEIAVYVMPGVAANTLVLPLGYGRTAAGRVAGDVLQAVAPVGFNAYALRSQLAFGYYTDQKDSADPKLAAGEARDVRLAEVVGKVYKFACTQDHFAMDRVGMEAVHNRVGAFIREATLEEFTKDPHLFEAASHGGGHGHDAKGGDKHEHGPASNRQPNLSLWKEWEYNGYKWGMTLDLTKCSGCNACVVACQAENNIPVVGKEQVARGRQMHWLRIDRYFTGSDVDNPTRVVNQPIPCMQCENAPCEQVCPVAATIHSHEGLNDMVYNRCVGTRYCSNNCPFKVRRFNFFDYHSGPYLPGLKEPPVHDLDKPEMGVVKMAYNPEVTLRVRGVMEKCTFCVQRIQNHKIVAKNERRPLEDMEVQPACAQACSSQAILFGDLNNETSKVAKAQADGRAYSMLEELNLRSRVRFLARITNPNPVLAASAPTAAAPAAAKH